MSIHPQPDPLRLSRATLRRMPGPTVARFNVTPVKSTALQHPDSIDLRHEGAVGDRRFVFARPDGTRLSGVSKAPLMPIRSTWDIEDELLTMRFADDSTVSGSALPSGERVEVRLFDRPVPARPVDGVFTDAVRSLVDETLLLYRVEEPEYGGGHHRASIVSLASVADLGSRGGREDLDPRRFRMLIELDGLEPYGEDAWDGRTVRIGEAVLRVGRRMPRCAMTTLSPDTGVKDFDTLAVLAEHRKVGSELLFGVYGDVMQAGRIQVGDRVELQD